MSINKYHKYQISYIYIYIYYWTCYILSMLLTFLINTLNHLQASNPEKKKESSKDEAFKLYATHNFLCPCAFSFMCNLKSSYWQFHPVSFKLFAACQPNLWSHLHSQKFLFSVCFVVVYKKQKIYNTYNPKTFGNCNSHAWIPCPRNGSMCKESRLAD